jgi:Carbohydrate-selective porin
MVRKTAAAAFLLAWTAAHADTTATETWSLHAQATFVEQYHPAFRSPMRGANSLDPGSRGNETFDATLFAGVRLWDGAELYANAEIDQGFGVSNTLGLAGFSSGEAYKVGKAEPYGRLQRLFLRQSFDLGGDMVDISPDANQLGGRRTADNLILTIGKFSVTDVFDTNTYAHDPKNDFLNWSLIDSGAFDYAADAWGYSYGATAELSHDWWTARLGVFDLSRRPNDTALQRGLAQFELVAEGEARFALAGQPGKLKLLGFLNRARMSSYRDAIAWGQSNGVPPAMDAVRRYGSKAGGALNAEQQIADGIGVFVRASLNDGSKEAYEFTEINNSIALGISVDGAAWSRAGDTAGLAFVSNGIARPARDYLAAGGLGILIGDGGLADYGRENIVEAFYDVPVTGWLKAGLDYQLVLNPAYNASRGPVSLFAFRLHAAG